VTQRGCRLITMTCVLPLTVILSGCVGYNTVGAFTTTNIGVNVQATPNPVAEISFARREGALEPTFQDGALPAVAASIEYEQAGLFGFASDNRSVFAGGNAAVLASGGQTDPSGLSAVGCLSAFTGDNPPPGVHASSGSAPTIFATDTTIGFKITLPTGGGGDLLPNVNLGYKRNEMALAPIFGRKDACSAEARKIAAFDALADAVAKAAAAASAKNAALANAWNQEVARRRSAIDQNKDNYWGVFSPSYLAVSNNGNSTGTTDASKNTGGFSARQVFATGKAAEAIAEYGIPGAIKRVASTSAPAIWPGEMLVISGNASTNQSFTISNTVPGNVPIAVTYAPNQNDTPPTAASALAFKIKNDLGMQASLLSATSDGNVVILRTPPGATGSWSVASSGSGTMTIKGPIP
jgi:hypothetical protein